MKIVTLYNHKGGVSKTTTTFNLAHALAERLGKRVLIVDADPQCNLTELALAKTIEALDEEYERTGKQTDLPGTTLVQALNPRLNGDRADVDIESIEIVPIDSSLPIYLFKGDITLNDAEDKLSYAHSQRLTTDTHQKRNYIAIYDMLQRLGIKHNLDYILIDVGPSAGALTRSFFLACDMFLVPIAPDRFNFQAVSTLSAIIKKWITEHDMVINDFKKLNHNVPKGKPKFAGIIIQRFQRYSGKPKPGFKIWMDKIPAKVVQELIPSLISATGDANVIANCCKDNPTIAEIPDFASLGPMMLASGKPIWGLSKTDTEWQGVVWDTRKAAIEEFKELFFDLAAKIDAQ